MRTIGKAVLTAVCGAALMLLALPGISAAAEPGAYDMDMGERIFSGKVGPWTGEARLVDMMAQMMRSGVTAGRWAPGRGRPGWST